MITSPGIPHLYPAPHRLIARAIESGIPVDNDIGLFFRSFADAAWDDFETTPRVICITGSNGKSTTTALIHHILAEAGRPVQMAGNIGRGVLDLDPAQDGEVVVLELSSYQTDLARSLTPDIAVFTELDPAHDAVLRDVRELLPFQSPPPRGTSLPRGCAIPRSGRGASS